MAARATPRQGDLFDTGGLPIATGPEDLPLQARQLLDWQQRLQAFQAPRFRTMGEAAQGRAGQMDLFGGHDPAALTNLHQLNPLDLVAQHLQFWRLPEQSEQGAALYFVLDHPPHLPGPLLLYLGETGQADRRWKGDHDCKRYLAAYGEAVQQAGLDSAPTIRFWRDAPAAVKQRRAMEQTLIRHWLPPFNKETRGRWATPFTTELD